MNISLTSVNLLPSTMHFWNTGLVSVLHIVEKSASKLMQVQKKKKKFILTDTWYFWMLENTSINSMCRDLSLKVSGMPTKHVQLHHLPNI